MSDVNYVLNWWFLFFVMGVINLPLTSLVFRKFTDSGYGFAKTLGLLTFSYIVFLLSLFKLLPLTTVALILIFIFLGLFNLFLFMKIKRRLTKSLKKNLRVILLQEVLFTCGLVFWAQIRAYQPDINGLEKFMDFGFINSILRTKFLPPPDLWFSGKPINYYWFGHLTTAVLTKISGIPSHITYNLMLATILGLILTGSFSLISTMVAKIRPRLNKRTILVGGIISAILLSFAGNFHTPFYILKEGRQDYWYPDATRFIGYNPETNDKTIHEFPIYSFVVSDLHAHLLNLPFVLLFIGLLYKYVISKEKTKYKLLPVLGGILGVMFMTNTWDFANYLLTSAVVIFLLNLRKTRLKPETFYKTTLSLGLLFAVGIIVALPFILNFESIAQGVKFTHTKTPIWQLGVLWGFPAVLTLILTLVLAIVRKIKRNDLFVLSLLLSGWILVVIPEFIYVKDIYVASHYRANTMFKLTYQAYVMFYLTSGFIAVRSIAYLARVYQKILLVTAFAIVFGSILYYPYIATNSYYHDLRNYKGLSGEGWVKEQYEGTYYAILWFRENTLGQPVILEAPGDSYTEYNLISSYTGLPTVSGWFVHEWLWRGSSDVPQKRLNDIVEIYTSKDALKTKEILTKYNVSYVVVGHFEKEKFKDIYEDKFWQLGKVVFESSGTKIYKIN